MRVGLVDVDGHRYPNLALMRISAYHKAKGDSVEWWWGELEYYDVVYMSKIFSDTYTKDAHTPMNCGKVCKGGTGYAIKTIKDREILDKSKNHVLPDEIERMFPDYSIYPQYEYAVSMTTRGCPNRCPWCHVGAKEGYQAVKVADVKDFWCGQKEIQVMDANITACPDKRDLMGQYRETGASIDFNQGVDIRLLDDDDIADINAMRLKGIHFAWDNPKQDLKERFEYYKNNARHKPRGRYGTVYVLTNFNSTMEENLHRIYTLRDLGYDPYVMVYDKPNAPQEIRRLQRWCNNIRIFRTCKRFEDYKP